MLKTTMSSLKFAKGLRSLKNADTELEKAKAAKYILELSNQHGGIFSKIVQILGTSPEQIDSLKNWQDSFDFGVEVEDVKFIFEKNLNQKWSSVFTEISKDCFCASIGQVNRATLFNGDEVAIKVQYPNIEKSIKDQLKVLKIMPVTEKFGPMKKWGMDVNEYYTMIFNTLTKELDYLKEVNNQLNFAKAMQELTYVKIAKIYTNLVSEKCYVQEFIHGDQLTDVINNWRASEKEDLAKKMIMSFLYSVFKGGVVHEDSNHFNYLFQKENGVNVCILDFGQCIYVDDKFQKALLNLFSITINEEDIDPFGLLVDLGFDQQKLSHIHGALPVLMKIILEPFLSNYNFDLATWNYKEKIAKVLGDSKWWFRSAGGVTFFETMKSFLGIKNMIARLEVKINWQSAYNDVLKLVSDDWKSYQSVISLNQRYTFSGLAKKLKVKVTKDGENIVDATFPARVLIDIEDFIDEDVLDKLKSSEIKLNEVIQNKIQSGMMPGEVFNLKSDDKEYLVWLE